MGPGATPIPEAPGSDMRDTTTALIGHYVDHTGLTGQVLEIGGHHLSDSAIRLFPEARFSYTDLDLQPSHLPNTIVADITDCRAVVPDESFDVVVSSDVFEHLERPWLAAAEIARILKPGGLAITYTLFAARNQPCPIDYWRFSREGLTFLFADLESLETGYDLSERRVDQPGFWPSGDDSVRSTSSVAGGSTGASTTSAGRDPGRRCRASRTATTRWPATCGWTPRAR